MAKHIHIHLGAAPVQSKKVRDSAGKLIVRNTGPDAWRVFEEGKSVSVAGPFKTSTEAAGYIEAKTSSKDASSKIQETEKRISYLEKCIKKNKAEGKSSSDSEKDLAASKKELSTLTRSKDSSFESWDDWTKRMKELGAVTFRETENKTLAYNKEGKRLGEISWSSRASPGAKDSYNPTSRSSVKEEIQKVMAQIDKIVRTGGDVSPTDPLNIRLNQLKRDLTKAKDCACKHGAKDGGKALEAMITDLVNEAGNSDMIRRYKAWCVTKNKKIESRQVANEWIKTMGSSAIEFIEDYRK